MSTPIAWTQEFRVNAVPDGWQHTARVTVLAGGGFVVTWQEQPLDETRVMARIFGADGTPRTGDIAITAGGSLETTQPVVEARPDGGFVVVWHQQETLPDQTVVEQGLRAQTFGADGQPISGVIDVDGGQDGLQGQPEVATLADGRFAVVWTSGSGDGRDVYARVFEADGSSSADPVRVNAFEIRAQRAPSVEATADGGFVVTWTDASALMGDESQNAVVMRAFGPDGTPREQQLVNTTHYGIQDESVVVQLAGGRIVVAWKDYILPDASNGTNNVYFRIFEADGTPVGPDRIANAERIHEQTAPAIAALPGGGFILSWTTVTANGNGGFQRDVLAQVFDADGAAAGEAVTVHADVPGNQVASSLSVLPDGRVVVTWEDATGTLGDVEGIHAQILELSNPGVTLSGTRRADTLQGTDGDDVLDGRGGNDRLVGANGSDQLRGGDGNDRLEGGAGSDVLLGQKGRDTLVGGDGDDRLDGGTENDVLRGDGGQDSLVGGHGNDRLEGGADDDVLWGQKGRDTLVGGEGDDRLVGGRDNDRLEGGEGADVFVFARRDGRDRITDWEDGVDLIDLSAFDISADRALSYARQVGDDVVLNFGGGHTLTLEDTRRADLDASDFIL